MSSLFYHFIYHFFWAIWGIAPVGSLTPVDHTDPHKKRLRVHTSPRGNFSPVVNSFEEEKFNFVTNSFYQMAIIKMIKKVGRARKSKRGELLPHGHAHARAYVSGYSSKMGNLYMVQKNEKKKKNRLEMFPELNFRKGERAPKELEGEKWNVQFCECSRIG